MFFLPIAQSFEPAYGRLWRFPPCGPQNRLKNNYYILAENTRARRFFSGHRRLLFNITL
jgi:hypothetical protein